MSRTYPNSNVSVSVPRDFNFVSNREFSFFTDEIHLAAKALDAEKKQGFVVGGNVKGQLINLQIPDNLAIVGDLHGDLESLFKILQAIEFRKFLSNQNNKLIFLGDYIDRGSDSAGVMQTICHLKRKYPDSVIPMRGNHEAIEKFHFLAHDLPSELTARYGLKGKIAYDKLLILFRLLPTSIVIEGSLLLIHGGVPTDTGKHTFFEAVMKEDKMVSEELLWNDPRADIPNNQDWCISRRGYGKHFGKNITKKYLELTKTKALVRGHEPCHGFRLDHDNSVLTLFSSKEAYQKFDAAYVLVSKDELAKIRDALDLAKFVQKI